MSELRPVHHSLAGRAPRTPNKMERINLPHELRDGLTQIALDIFVDASNAGHPLQAAVLAVYLSGIQHGAAATKGANQ